jgi:uncharacterized protein (DUF1330 family)
VEAYEAGLRERTIVIEFESAAQAIATYNSERYQAAAKKIVGAVERDIRIVEGS